MEKYKNFGLLVLALLFALPAAAQLGEERHNFAVGINGGLNMSSVSFNPKIKLNTLNTMSMGVTMRYMSEKYFKMMCGVQMEINYSQRGWDEKNNDWPAAPASTPAFRQFFQPHHELSGNPFHGTSGIRQGCIEPGSEGLFQCRTTNRLFPG